MADQSIRTGGRVPEINPGDVVKITGGPFAGGRARVQAVDVDKSQVRVEMKVLGQPAPFTVKLDQVKLAN
ncbi:MAG: KOW motif-containing protein [Chloroflexi bacterium]|nr:KOW motif-containing protein [Chloroflexota bacterium]